MLMPKHLCGAVIGGALLVALVGPSIGLAHTLTHDVRPSLPRTDGLTLFLRALHLENGAVGAPNPRQALALYCEAGARGEPRAYFKIAWIYLRGKAVRRDVTIASAWLHKAANAGVAEATAALAILRRPAAAPRLPSCAELARDARRTALPLVTPADLAAVPAGVPDVPARALGVPPDIRALVREIAPLYGLNARFVIAVIATESGFNRLAVSPKNAMGLMQLMPQTAARLGVKHPFDPAENIRAGVSYLKSLLQRFGGRIDLALAAYNAGEAAVEAYGGIPPYLETHRYVERVENLFAGRIGTTPPVLTVSRGNIRSKWAIGRRALPSRKGRREPRVFTAH